MIAELTRDRFHGWCSYWPEGIDRFPYLWADVCKLHDVMTYLHELGEGSAVSLYGQIYDWEKMGFDGPLTQEEQDMWLLQAILDIACCKPDLTPDEREEVRMNACSMYLGLRTLGRIYRGG